MRIYKSSRFFLTRIAVSSLSIVTFIVLLVLIMGIIYGLFPNIQIYQIAIFVAFISIIPIALFLRRMVNNKFYVVASLIIFALTVWIVSANQSLIADIACRSQDSIQISNLANRELTQRSVEFCGTLGSCESVEFEMTGSNYEVCIIYDIWDRTKAIEYIGSNITNSNDPLVQISNQMNLLEARNMNSLVFLSGFITGMNKEQCYVQEGCESSINPFASIYRSETLLNKYLEMS